MCEDHGCCIHVVSLILNTLIKTRDLRSILKLFKESSRDWQLKNGTGNFKVNICFVILLHFINTLIKIWKWDSIPSVLTFWNFLSSLLTIFVTISGVWKSPVNLLLLVDVPTSSDIAFQKWVQISKECCNTILVMSTNNFFNQTSYF